jgi:hypothetical protein
MVVVVLLVAQVVAQVHTQTKVVVEDFIKEEAKV